MKGKRKALSPTPVAITKVSSNDTVPMVYIVKEAQKRTGLERGMRVMLSVDKEGRLIIERIPE
jgi:hypothetical protein